MEITPENELGITYQHEIELEPYEVVMVVEKVVLKCTEGTVGRYIVVGTSRIDPEGAEDVDYDARLIIYEVKDHKLSIVAESKEKRCVPVISSCQGFLITSTEGPNFVLTS